MSDQEKHECIVKMDNNLKPYNAKLAAAFIMTESMNLETRYLMQTEKLDKESRSRKKPPVVTINYCPFCGKSLLPESKEPAP